MYPSVFIVVLVYSDFWRRGTARIRLEFDLYLKCVHRHHQRVGRHLACELTLANATGIVRNNFMLEYVFSACMLSTLSDDLSILFLCMPGGGYLVERWVRGCAAQIGCFFGLSGFAMATFLFENWFRYRSRFCKMHNFR